MRRLTLITLGFAIVMGAAFTTTTAVATTGTGCWQIENVPSYDDLNLRAEPSASSAVLFRLRPDGGAIISGGKNRQDAEAKCIPHTSPIGSRWCPVSVFIESGVVRGWLKRRYIAPSGCP